MYTVSISAKYIPGGQLSVAYNYENSHSSSNVFQNDLHLLSIMEYAVFVFIRNIHGLTIEKLSDMIYAWRSSSHLKQDL